MEYSRMYKIKNYLLQHRVFVVSLLCLTIMGILFYVYKDSYGNRLENGEFSEIYTYLLEIKENDKDIYQNLELKEIKKEVKGIDVSSWQGDIDWEEVKEENLDFVIIRCGYRNLSNSEIHEDKNFKYNISEANRLGIPVGVYFYSTAISEKEALEEASYVLNLIKDYDIIYPVVYDFELYNSKRTEGISIAKINDNALTFLDYIDAHGYQAMLYSNKRYLEDIWITEDLGYYKLWYAYYSDLEEEVNYDMIQYSDTGSIKGISTKVDLNRANFSYEVVE